MKRLTPRNVARTSTPVPVEDPSLQRALTRELIDQFGVPAAALAGREVFIDLRDRNGLVRVFHMVVDQDGVIALQSTSASAQAVSHHAHERGLFLAARLLPSCERDRYVREWHDHLQCHREDGGAPQTVVRSLMWHSLRLSLTIRLGRLRHAVRRTS